MTPFLLYTILVILFVMKNKIYLDNAATTKCDIEVVNEMIPYLSENYGNPSSHHQFGQIAKIAIEKSREKIGEILIAEPYEIIFTSGGTEALNSAIIGAAIYQKRMFNKNRILASKIEHHSVLNTINYLKNFGFVVELVDVCENGNLNLNDLINKISDSVALICVMHVNNEIGTILQIEEIGEIAKSKNILFISDTVQSVGKIDNDFAKFPSSIAVASAHKINGPKGIGILLLKRGIEIDSLIHGGAQERNHRGGTENVASIVGFAKAIEIWHLNREKYFIHFKNLKNILINKLKSLDEIIINGDANNSMPNIVSVSIDSKKLKIDGEMFLINLDLNGVAVSSGSACTTGSTQPSHVLKAIGHDVETIKSTFRFSFGKENTEEEINSAAEIFIKLVNQLKN